jgi:cation:H+ antiporter
VLRVDVPVAILVALALVPLLRAGDGRIGRLEGAALLGGIVAYTAVTMRAARREATAVRDEFAGAMPAAPVTLARALLLVALGLVGLVVGADLLTRGAVAIARGLGVSEAAIGLTIVAVGTSLPELATSLVAARRGEGDVAVGNLIGSNIFNGTAIVGAAALAHPLGAGGVAGVDLAVMCVFSVALLPLMRTGFRISRLEGTLLAAAYAAYVATLLAVGRGVPAPGAAPAQ